MTATLSFDDLFDDQLQGWAWSDGDAQALATLAARPYGGEAGAGHDAPRLPAEPDLRVGSVVLGRIRRTVPRPDVDGTTGAPSIPKGFSVPAISPHMLALLTGRAELSPSIHFGDRATRVADLPGRLQDVSAFRSLALAEPGSPARVADLWFSGTHDLRLRLEGSPSDPVYQLRLYQPVLAAGRAALELTHETTLNPSPLGVVTVPLLSPLLPLLAVVVDSEDVLVRVDLLPFPSLCRGGLHWPELAASGATGDYLRDLRLVGDQFVREATGWDGAPPRCIDAIEVDWTGANGSEHIFGGPVLEWLAQRGVTVRLLPDAGGGAAGDERSPARDEELAAHLDVVLAAAGALPVGGADAPVARGVLRLPASAVPAIGAVVARRLSPAADAPVPFIVADLATSRPLWAVSVPADAQLDALQPSIHPLRLPRLTLADGAAPMDAVAEEAGPVQLPLAVVSQEVRVPDDRRRVLPVPLDHPAPVLRAGLDGPQPWRDGVSLIIPVRNRAAEVDALVRTAAMQRSAEHVEVLIVSSRAAGHLRPALAALLAETFGERGRLLDHDAPWSPSALRNLGAAEAGGALLLFAEPGVLLHDPRTVETLSLMANGSEVASAACLLLSATSEGGTPHAFRSAGYFPRSVEFLGGPHLTLAEPDCEEALPWATYPVAGNNFCLTMVRAATWASLGGMDSALFPDSGADLDYCARAMERGYRHLCTTALTAFVAGPRRSGGAVDLPARGLMARPSLVSALGAATVLRRL